MRSTATGRAAASVDRTGLPSGSYTCCHISPPVIGWFFRRHQPCVVRSGMPSFVLVPPESLVSPQAEGGSVAVSCKLIMGGRSFARKVEFHLAVQRAGAGVA